MKYKQSKNNKYSFYINKLFYILIFIFVVLFSFITTADVLTDKQGHDVYETLYPTAESLIDENTISDAIRYVPSGSKDYSNSNYTGPSKNIFSSNTIVPQENYDEYYNDFYKGLLTEESLELINTYGAFTRIRHTASITNVDDDRYNITTDTMTNRIKMKIIYDITGEIEAKNGFYKVGGKTFYFDSDGLMVLGPALDDIGNYYFFSYETGELIEEIQKK